MDDFYAARTANTAALPWSNFAPPFSASTASNDTLALLRPYNGNDLTVHGVSKMVNNVKNDTPECIAETA